jgi:hypothetical protein
MLRSVQRRREHRKHQRALSVALGSNFSTSDEVQKPEPAHSRGRVDSDGSYGQRIANVAHRDPNGYFRVSTPNTLPVSRSGTPANGQTADTPLRRANTAASSVYSTNGNARIDAREFAPMHTRAYNAREDARDVDMAPVFAHKYRKEVGLSVAHV